MDARNPVWSKLRYGYIERGEKPWPQSALDTLARWGMTLEGHQPWKGFRSSYTVRLPDGRVKTWAWATIARNNHGYVDRGAHIQ